MSCHRARSYFVLVAVVVAACSGSSGPAGGAPGGGDGGSPSNPSGDSGSGLPAEGGAASLDAQSADGEAADASSGTDTLASSFVFVGCNRLQKADWDSTQNPSSANLPQLKQTFADIVALADKPRFFFFTGDLVLALKQGTTDLTGQLAAWAQIYKVDPVASTAELVPLVGNHEMLYKDKSSGAELSNGPADAVWTQWVTTQGFAAHAGNGPTNAAPNPDALQDDQSKLSYSFDDDGTHFVVLNTDTWTTAPDSTTGSTQIGWIALQWLTADLRAAQSNAAIERIFVFGHKPIVAPSGATTSDEAINPALASGLASLLDGTPKVKGYLCAHAHEWDARKLPGNRGVYQVVAGNGGSQLESGWNVTSPYYGFTQARVYTSGRVGLVSYQRAVPNPYTASSVETAKAAAEVVIAE